MRIKTIAKRALAIMFMFTLVAPFLVGPTNVEAQTTGIIVFDYSHGQYSAYNWNTTDSLLEGNLTALGYTVVWAYGGINATILSDAAGFVAGSVYGPDSGYTAAEFTAIADWFNAGNKFMWIGYDSDYYDPPDVYQTHNDNMTAILEDVGSHIYGEPTAIQDPYSNCGAGYRPVANGTSDDAFVADIVADVSKVMMHGPTLVYGSTTGAEGGGVTALHTNNITDVYPLLFFGASATVLDSDLTAPYSVDDNDVGPFCAAAMEINAGDAGTGVLVVSGASPYGDYRPMTEQLYKGVTMDGYNLVKQAIDFGMQQAAPAPPDMTMILLAGGIGVVVILLVVIVLMKRK